MDYQEKLVYTQSEDGLLLAGIHIAPSQQTASAIGIIWIHGNTGNFYDLPYITIGRALATLGYHFVSGNTRGHDITATLYRMPQDFPVAGGSAWERLEEAPADIAAWVKLGMQLGMQRFVLIGHSQGATKVVTYQGQRKETRVAGIVLASPEQRGHWEAVLVEAQQHLLVGQPDALLTLFLEEPWYKLSAQNIVSREQTLVRAYTTTTDAPYLATISCPILALYGTDGDIGGASDLEALRAIAQQAQHLETKLIDGADHVYTGCETGLASVIADWTALTCEPSTSDAPS